MKTFVHFLLWFCVGAAVMLTYQAFAVKVDVPDETIAKCHAENGCRLVTQDAIDAMYSLIEQQEYKIKALESRKCI